VTDPVPAVLRDEEPFEPLERRLVLFGPEIDAVRFVGRNKVRQTIVSMTPEAGGLPRPRVVVASSGSGLFWGLVDANGLTLALRVQDFATAVQAQSDAATIGASAQRLQPHRVRDTRTGLYSAWFSLDGLVVLLAGQAWRRPVPPPEQNLLRTLRKPAVWGALGWSEQPSGRGPRRPSRSDR